MATPRLTLWTRGIVFFALAAWITAGPIYRQVFDGKAPWVREWRMYGTRAARSCQTRFERRSRPTGPWSGFHRRSLLEAEGVTSARQITSNRAARRAARELCAHHPPGTEIRYRRRCGHYRRGWSRWRVTGDLCPEGDE